MTTNCPRCKAELEMEESAYDQIVNCPKCLAEIMVVKPSKQEVHVAAEHTPQQAKGAIEVIVKDFDLPLWSWIKAILGIWVASLIIAVFCAAFAAVIYFVFWLVTGHDLTAHISN